MKRGGISTPGSIPNRVVLAHNLPVPDKCRKEDLYSPPPGGDTQI